MTDRELLKAAARMVGITLVDDHYYHEGASQWVRWNPLTDDGDRYRLARAMGLHINFYLKHVRNKNGDWFDWGDSGLGDDEAYAIVRAAAAIRSTGPCGECHLQPGERCDVCGQEQEEQP